ncbi:helix-turn-helix domain-containing protein [Oceanobacillus picturae]|uniref:helix-turn-helix domain-containing protein n=1 Tax=Oceanobacillus picturae TaxID=171693 RepID=UPI000B1A0680|nr:helix-turn-helix transcriptional regulator [Oceanobacillus picturae]
MTDNILGKRMKFIREKKDIKQKEVALALGVSPYQLSRYESGKSKPDPELITKIAKYYSVTTDYLHGLSDQPQLSEKEAFEAFHNNPELERWYRQLPNKEEDLIRLKKIWEAFKDED